MMLSYGGFNSRAENINQVNLLPQFKRCVLYLTVLNVGKSCALLNANKTLLSAHSFLGVLVCKQKT
jgi:hypothetical protein